MMDLFLYNEQVMPLTSATDPIGNSAFPLPADKAHELMPEQIIEVMSEVLQTNPAYPLQRPERFYMLCHLLFRNFGINALRKNTKNAAVQLTYTTIPNETFMALAAIQEMGELSLEVIDEAVWDHVN